MSSQFTHWMEVLPRLEPTYSQYRDQIQFHTKKNSLHIYIYHGSTRNDNADFLTKYDIVLTTYNILSAEMKHNTALFKVKWFRIMCDEVKQ